MPLTYHEIDEKMLNKMKKRDREFLITICTGADFEDNKRRKKERPKCFKEMRIKQRSYYILFCPYCKNHGLFLTYRKPNKNKQEPFQCVFCGETNPEQKISFTLEKSQELLEMAKEIIKEKNKLRKARKRLLLEQCIVVLTTGVEIYLRDIYATLFNIQFVKEKKSLYEKFYKDTKNNFSNIGNTNKKYKDDLNINLKQIIGQKNFDILRMMQMKRNVIVHNNGNADSAYANENNSNITLNDQVPINITEVRKFIASVYILIKSINKEIGPSFENERMIWIEKFINGKTT